MSWKPLLIVFDLDYTLWPFWVDTHVTPPFRKNDKNEVVDAHGSKIRCYSEVPEMLRTLNAQGYLLGVASRTSEIEGANQLLDLFGWSTYFHFKNKTGIEYKDMLFFDDENRNIIDINKLGVTSILVRNGMTTTVLQQGLETHKKKSSENRK